MLAGTYIAGLIFFINPHLPFASGPVFSGVLFYASLLAPCSLTLLLAVTRFKKQSIQQWFPVALTVVMLSGALMFWTHAYYFGFYLPPGINKRLLKAAVFLSLSTIIGFYTLLIHRIKRRRYGKRAMSIFGLLALSSIYVVMERREAYQPAIEPKPRPTTFRSSQRPFLCVIGIDTASFDVILPLAEQGQLPFFRQALEEGAYARLPPLEPVKPAPLWTTLVTGKYPYKHGIVGAKKHAPYFLDPELGSSYLNLLPLAVGFESWGIWGHDTTVNQNDMRVLPLWEILSRLQMSTALIGWPMTEPANPDVHLTLTDTFFNSGAMDSQLAYPKEMAERARLFRTGLDKLNSESLSRFGPKPPNIVLESLAKDQWRKDLAFFVIDQNPVDAVFLHLPGLRDISEHYFGGYSAVQFKGNQNEESVEASRLLSAYYAEIDDFLAKFEAAIHRPKLMVLVSVHGVGRTTGLSEAQRWLNRQPATRGDLDDGADGILVFLGEGIQKADNIRTANLVDLPPTLLYGLGFPVARDLDGSVLIEIFSPSSMARQPLTFVPSYEAFSASPQIIFPEEIQE